MNNNILEWSAAAIFSSVARTNERRNEQKEQQNILLEESLKFFLVHFAMTTSELILEDKIKMFSSKWELC